MKKKNAAESEQIKLTKDEFRRHQRNLPFSEKMKIAFSLAVRDKTIRRAIHLPKTTINEESK